MHPDVLKLIEVQKVDQKTARLRKDLIALPKERSQREGRLNGLRDSFAEATKSLQDAEVESHSSEISLKQADDELKKLESRLNEVKNNAEYQATLLQIESVKSERNRLEEEGLNLIERIDSLRAARQEQEAALKDHEAVFAEFLIEAEELCRQREAEVAKVEVGRDDLLLEIPKELLVKYERLFEARASLAVCVIEGGCCTGCYTSVQPNLLVKVRGDSSIVNCSSCQRFLFVTG